MASVFDNALDWESFNKRELMIFLFKRGHRVKQKLSLERLIHLIKTGEPPTEDEVNNSKGRADLERHIHERYGTNFSQLPSACRGKATQGLCTKHPCTEPRRILCFLENQAKML